MRKSQLFWKTSKTKPARRPGVRHLSLLVILSKKTLSKKAQEVQCNGSKYNNSENKKEDESGRVTIGSKSEKWTRHPKM